MTRYESEVRERIKTDTVDYYVVPIYSGDNPVPDGIYMLAIDLDQYVSGVGGSSVFVNVIVRNTPNDGTIPGPGLPLDLLDLLVG
jgi:hypothetical protein